MWALVIAFAAAVAAVLPNPGMFMGMGLGGFAVAMGWLGYRRREENGWTRLAGAGAITVGMIALLISLGRYGLTLAVINRLLDSLA